MYLKPFQNTKLYGMNIFFNEIITLYDQKKMPTKILLSGKRGLGKSNILLARSKATRSDIELPGMA